ncbi:MAG: hypothetical protein AB7G52_02690 [Arcobacter sp.]
MLNKIILDIDEELLIIESIYAKYIKLPSNLIFVRNNRWPLEDKSKLEQFRKLHMVSDRPWHPILCVQSVVDIITLYIANDTSSFDYFIRNPLIRGGGQCFINNRDKDPEEIIMLYIESIAVKDLNTILRTIDLIYNKVSSYTNLYPEHIFTFDIETGYVILENRGNVKAYRFDEYLEYINNN